jgi:hypothetical protein
VHGSLRLLFKNLKADSSKQREESLLIMWERLEKSVN